MWIERVNLVGFGKLSHSTIEFSSDKLNLVIEHNEYGKSTVAEAILALLYDFPGHQRASGDKLKEREAKKPLEGGPYQASLDLSWQGRSLRIFRDFSEKTLKVFDLNNGDAEVTAEFLTGPTSDDLGARLLGMGRELFQKTCFVGQRELDAYALSQDLELSSLFQNISDTTGATTTSADAIGIIEDALASFVWQGKKLRAEKLKQALDSERTELLKRADKLEAEHASASHDLERLSELDKTIVACDEEITAQEYLNLCLQTAEIENRLLKARQRLMQFGTLKQQSTELAAYQNFPIERLKQVEELWTRRDSRSEDKERLESDLRGKRKTQEVKDLELRERFEGLSHLTRDDAQTISGLARTFKSVSQELDTADKKLNSELERLRNESTDSQGLDEVRKIMRRLDSRDLDSAYTSANQIKQIKDEIAQAEKSLWQARMLATEIEQEQRSRIATWRNNMLMLSILAVVFVAVAVLSLLVFKLSWTHPAVLSAAGALVVCAIIVAALMNPRRHPKTYRQQDFANATQEEDKQQTLGLNLHAKIIQQETHLAHLARKAFLESGDQLLNYLERWATFAPQYQNHDLMEELASRHKSRVADLAEELKQYFDKANWKDVPINQENAIKLADSINQYQEELRSLKSSKDMVNHQMAEVKFLEDELRDIDAALQEHFRQANLPQAETTEAGYKQYMEAAASFRKWQTTRSEITRLEQDSTNEYGAAMLPELITKLQNQQSEIWSKLSEMVASHPEVEKLPAPQGDQSSGARLITLREKIKGLRAEQQELTVQVRSATRNFDENYLDTLESIESIDKDLLKIRRAKTALELARDTFKRLSNETHIHWSSQLNNISKQVLNLLDTDIESLHFDQDMHVTARRRGQVTPLQQANITSQLSIGTKEQIFFLSRMIILRFLSHNVPLPFILDEPFSESDDKRFLSLARFLINVISKHHQVILFSCHHVRHQWLFNQLEPGDRDLLRYCHIKPNA